jgi:mutator protein MutT
LTRRPKGSHLEGLWEFPGGKCETAESLPCCLARELREELAVDVVVGDEVLVVVHPYPDRCVELHFLKCRLTGDPVPQLGQEMRWVTREELRSLEFPPADRELIERLAAT